MLIESQVITLRIVCNVLLGAVLGLILQVSIVTAQSNLPLQNAPNKSSPVIGEDAYNHVLDILFPRDKPASDGTIWVIVLRFKPSSHPESQIVIRKSVSKVEVIEYTSPDGSIYNKLNEALARGSEEDAVELAKLIRVMRTEVSVPPTFIRRWQATLFGNIPPTTKALRAALEKADKTGAESFVLHGTFYDLWYEQGLNKMSFNLYDVEVDKSGSDGEFKLVRWMNAVRRDIVKLKQ